jgi:surfeit locus 1 family protein
MLQRLRDARLLCPTLTTIVAFAILIGLGTWQWQRMQWKEGLLRELQVARTTGPVPLRQLLAENSANGRLQVQKLRFRQVEITSGEAARAALYVWDPQRDGPAWSVIRALPLTEPVAGYDHAFVIEGTVPEKDRTSLSFEVGVRARPTIIGRVRLDAPNPSAPDPVSRAEWFTRDLAAMAEHVRKTTSADEARFLPFFIEYTGPVRPPLRANPPQISLPNRHFEYALTWWGLAATLIGVYATFVISRLRGAS